MAQNWVPKQVNWINRFSQAIVALMACADALTELCNEYADNAYGTGGANAIIDATVQSGQSNGAGPLPASTAYMVAEAEGAIAGSGQVLSLIGVTGSMRGYLENVRP